MQTTKNLSDSLLGGRELSVTRAAEKRAAVRLWLLAALHWVGDWCRVLLVALALWLAYGVMVVMAKGDLAGRITPLVGGF